MDLDDIKELILHPFFSSKCNNYIVEKFSSSEIDTIFDTLPNEVIRAENGFCDESDSFGSINGFPKKIITIPIDFLLTAFDLGKIKSSVDAYRLTLLLEKNKKAIELVMRHNGVLSEREQQAINTLLSINSYYIYSITLLEESESLASYQTINGKMLDYREDYTRIRIGSNW